MGEAELTRFFPKHQQLPTAAGAIDGPQAKSLYIYFVQIHNFFSSWTWMFLHVQLAS